MALTLPEDIEPAAAATAPSPEPAPADTEATIPDEILEIPAFAGLLAGKPAAVWNAAGEPNPVGSLIVENREALKNAGFNFYISKDKKTQVFFNAAHISGKELQQADEDETLREIAVPLSELLASYDSVLGEGNGSVAAEPGSVAPATAGPMASPAPAGVQNRLGTARLKNFAMGGPTSGPYPGSGRLLNSLGPVI